MVPFPPAPPADTDPAPPADTDPARPRPLGPDSLIWRLGFSRASLLLAGRALLLQVAHPVVGAGVRDFSTFQVDPWGRLDHTVTSLLAQLFGGDAAATEADRLHRLHRTIRGTGFDGSRYTAADPAAWAWVHLVNGDTVLSFHDRFGEPLDPAARRQFYAEWRQVGALLGVRRRDMPGDPDGLRAYVETTAGTVLGDNPTVRALLATLTLRGVPAPGRLLPRPLWQAVSPLGGSLLHDATVGTAPAVLRRRLGLRWSAADERRLRRLASTVRTVAPRIPDRLLHYPAAYRAMRSAGSATVTVTTPWQAGSDQEGKP